MAPEGHLEILIFKAGLHLIFLIFANDFLIDGKFYLRVFFQFFLKGEIQLGEVLYIVVLIELHIIGIFILKLADVVPDPVHITPINIC